MNLFRVMEISGSALLAERMRAEIVSANLANAETTRTEAGGPYQRMHVVFGAYDGGLSGERTFGALERVSDHLPVPPPHEPRQRLWRIIAQRTVLAAGAVERPIVFGGNDRPGSRLNDGVRPTCGSRAAEHAERALAQGGR